MSSWVSSWMGNENKNEGDDENMNDVQEEIKPTAEEIRQKRMARLEALEKQAKEKRETEEAQAEKKRNSLQKETKAFPPPSPSDILRNTKELADTTTVSSNPIQKAQTRILTKKKSFSLDDYVSDIGKKLLHVTMEDGDKPMYSFLKQLSNEKKNNGETLKLTIANTSEVLYGRLSSPFLKKDPPISTIEYLMNCYGRCDGEMRLVNSLRLSDSEKEELRAYINSIRDMCVNYSATSLHEPDMFPNDPEGLNRQYLQQKIRSDQGVPTKFLEGLVKELEQEDRVSFVFNPIFQSLVSELLQTQPDSILANFTDCMSSILSLCRNKCLASAFTSIPGFILLPGAPRNGQYLQTATALGIILRFSTDNKDPGIVQMFSNMKRRTRADVEGSINTLRTRLDILQNLSTEIVRSILKAGQNPKERILLWFNDAMEVNAERAKENPNVAIASSAGMFVNLTAVLLRLCGPFMEHNSPKANLIDKSFLLCKNLNLFDKEDTKLLSSESQSNLLTDIDASSFNFITRCYFLTARSIHLGPVAIMRQYRHLMQQLSYLQNHMGEDPRMEMHFEHFLTKKMITDAKILNPPLIQDLIQFSLLSCRIICQICLQRDNIDANTITLPLPTPPPSALFTIPEHFVEDVTTILVFIARMDPKVLNGYDMNQLLTFIMIFLSTPEYMTSPHLRAQMSQVLFEIFLPPEEVEERHTAGISSGIQLLGSHPLAQQYLAPNLLSLYGEVEQTGFYEKLEHRYNIACLLKYLWKLPQHKLAFMKISKDKEKFVRFANGLMNHINGLVTDALTNLPEIKSLQEEMGNMNQWMQLDESMREQKQSLLNEKERTVTSSLQLANETIHMMSYLTSDIQEPFMLPELEDRLASMLNSVFVKLVGPRGLELKVNNPEDYKFRPKVMLQEIVQTYLHFSTHPSFIQSIALDGFYSPSIFKKGSHIVKRIHLLSDAESESFIQFISAVEECSKEVQNNMDQLGEIPEDFLDPLMCTLMQDPVTLPGSGYIVDRATIHQHLLNDPTDPFTRAPLTIDQVIPNDEIREKINAWMESRTKK